MCRKALAGESPGCELRGAGAVPEGGGEVGLSSGYSRLWGETTTHNPWTAGRTSLRARGPKFPITKAGRLETKRGGIPGGVEPMVHLRCLGSCPLHRGLTALFLHALWCPAGTGVAGPKQTLLDRCPPAPRAMPGLEVLPQLLLSGTEALHKGAEAALPTETTTWCHSCFCFAKPGRARKKSARAGNSSTWGSLCKMG